MRAMPPRSSHPGAFVRLCVLEPLSLNVTQTAAKLGVTRAALSNFLNANAALSPGMAMRGGRHEQGRG
jgi:antitoxin HigA-1